MSFEWLETDGSGFQVSCGAARVGGHSINYPKNNFRLYFRTEYGPGRLEADLFSEAATGRQPTGVPPLDRHDSLDLRGGAHDSVFYLGTRGQYLRNLWMDETELAMGHLAPHGRFAHLYLDGVYDGLFHVRERFDADDYVTLLRRLRRDAGTDQPLSERRLDVALWVLGSVADARRASAGAEGRAEGRRRTTVGRRRCRRGARGRWTGTRRRRRRSDWSDCDAIARARRTCERGNGSTSGI